jgi:hypothetical protein
MISLVPPDHFLCKSWQSSRGPEVRVRSWRSLALLVCATVVGCNSGTEPTPSKPSFSHTGTPDITGSIFRGPGEQNLCSAWSLEAPLFIRAFSADLSLTVDAFTSCPANQFSMAVEPGSYLVRLTLPSDQPLGLLPRRWLEPVPVTVDAEDVIKDIHVENGTALGGRTTVDGVPTGGVSLTAFYASLPGSAGNFGASGPDGTWDDGMGRSAMILQNDLEYTFSGCDLLPVPGIRSITGFPSGPVLFPSGLNQVNCDFTSGDALQYTHQRTRLKLTSFPGDIGGLSVPTLFPDVGFGYSAQFPRPAGQSPLAGPNSLNRQLFRGGLVLAVAPDVALGGTELEGYFFCSVSPCRAFGFDGQASVSQRNDGGKDITWTYSDAGSQRPQGLHVVQRSFEGEQGLDYVLYAFRIRNEGKSAITFTPGLFLDFDVSPDISINTGYTELGGQLMVTTDADGTSRHLGSLIVNSPPRGRNYFFTPTISESEAVAGLNGKASNRSIEFSDVSTLHGGKTVTLKKRQSTDFWVAIVAGESRAQVIANAQAAIADATARQRSGNAFLVDGASVTPRSSGALAGGAKLRLGQVCKGNCEADR